MTYQGDGVGELAGFGLASYDGDDAALHFGELAEALGGCPVARAPSLVAAPPSGSPAWTWAGSVTGCRPGG